MKIFSKDSEEIDRRMYFNIYIYIPNNEMKKEGRGFFHHVLLLSLQIQM